MSDGGEFMLLLAGPAGAGSLYWMLYRYYRNTDKSHDFERETAVVTKQVTGWEEDRKISEVKGTQEARIEGDNVSDYRTRRVRVRDRSLVCECAIGCHDG